MATVVIVACQADSGVFGMRLAAGLQHGLGSVVALEQFPDPQQHFALLQAADVALVVIGPRWQALPAGTPGIDAMRGAVDYLLRGDRPRLIVPILTDGAAAPIASALPPGLQPIAYVQALEMPVELADSDIQRVRERIRAYRGDVVKAARAKGNYLWFKIASYAPLATLLLVGVVGYFFPNAKSRTLDEILTFLSSALFFLALCGMWVVSAIVAGLARRFGWLVANILALPSGVLAVIVFFALQPLLKPYNDINVVCVILTALLLVNGVFLHPIFFSLVLPPFRKKHDGV